MFVNGGVLCRQQQREDHQRHPPGVAGGAAEVVEKGGVVAIPSLARKTIIDTVRDVEGVLPDRKVEALFLRFGDSAHIFRIRWWLESYVDTRRMFDRVNSALYDALNAAGIEIPYPQLDIRRRSDSGNAIQAEI